MFYNLELVILFFIRCLLRDRIEKYAFSSYIVGFLILVINIMYCTFTYVLYDRVPFIEYYFGSIGCVLYTTAFVFLAGKRIENNRIVASLSSLFLPVYALHWEVKVILRPIDTSFLGAYSPLGQFVLLSIVTLLFSWLVMKIPFLNKYFNI